MDSIPNSLNITHKNVWLTVGRITNEILGVKGLKAIPEHIKSASSLTTFKTALKTYLFRRHFRDE